jgi:hypothetical protein
MALNPQDLQAIRDLFELVLEEKQVVTRIDISHLPTKEEYYKREDEMMKELKDMREEHSVLSHQVSYHGDRLQKVENQLQI